jgi:hypothetical protein
MMSAMVTDCYTSRVTTMPRRKALKIDAFTRHQALRRTGGRRRVAPVYVQHAEHAEPLTTSFIEGTHLKA